MGVRLPALDPGDRLCHPGAMSESPEDVETEKTYVLEGYGSYDQLRAALTAIESEFIEAFVDTAPANHGAFIAFDGISLGRNHKDEWQARVTIVAPARFQAAAADAFARYA